MIELLLAILATLTAGDNLCALGSPVDWNTATVTDTSAYVLVRTPDVQFDLYADGVLFVYRDDMALGDDGHPHGECARQMP